MANKLKSKKSQVTDPTRFKPEKEEQVKVKQLVKDERTYKILGTVFLLTAIFLFIAFTSYLFTWEEDQDKVFHGADILYPSSEVKVANLLGNLGAYISHQFIYKGFGLASFLFCSFFLIVGANLVFGKKLFSIGRNLRYVITGVVFFSVLFAFLTKGSSFPWGGAFGELSSEWLTRFLGWIGTAALLFVAGLAYIIWRFNPVFSLPQKAAKQHEQQAYDDNDGGSDTDELVKGEEAKLYIQTPAEEKRNILKSEGGVMVVSPASTDEHIDFRIIEKEEEADHLPASTGSSFPDEDLDYLPKEKPVNTKPKAKAEDAD